MQNAAEAHNFSLCLQVIIKQLGAFHPNEKCKGAEYGEDRRSGHHSPDCVDVS